MRHARFHSRKLLVRAILLAAGACAILQAAPQAPKLGSVRGTLEQKSGKRFGGVWLVMDNPDLGMNYRTDVNPAGQFVFTQIYPGTYQFRISPAMYQILSPAQIAVKPGQYLPNVKVVVVSAPERQSRSGEDTSAAAPGGTQ